MVDLFLYLPGTGLFHKADARLKFIAELLFVTAVLGARPVELSVLALLLVFACRAVKMPAASLARDLGAFLPLFIVVFLGAALPAAMERLSSGRSDVFGSSFMPVVRGLFAVFSFVLIVTATRVFVSSTRPSEIRSAVEFFLKPFPFVRGKDAAIMLELMIGFFPMLFHAMEEIRDAVRSRGLAGNVPPFRRLKYFILPLLETTFATADEVTPALLSRCYPGNRIMKPSTLSVDNLMFTMMVAPLVVFLFV